MASTNRILFVCTANMYRSPTAEKLFKGREDVDVRSAGTWMEAPNRISRELIEWADTIFVMENHHKKNLLKISSESEMKIIVLDIPAIYKKDSPELIEMLKAKLSNYLKIDEQ
jgi:predicted protein tyrosine phosphatase